MTTRIQNPEELLKKYEEYKDLVEVRADLDYSGDQMFILVCGGTGCVSSKSLNIVENFNKLIKEHGMEGKVHASITGCFGFCEKGPIVKVFPENVFYVQVTPDDAKEIFEQHIMGGEVVDRLLYVEPITQKSMHDSLEMPFYKQQMRIALRHCGLIDPEIIEEYIGVGGYQSLAKVITQMTPEEAIDIMKQSGLGGRGGAGFSTGRKWEFGRMYKSDRKYVICNADEGDPGAFMDRSIMEGDAHTVIEGMAIAAYCIGADQGYVYIRAEYPLAVKRLQIAIDEARELGLLGKNILGTDFSFDVDVRLGAGAFVCGEETALIQSIQGNRGEPTTKPPFPAEKGLWQQPTIVNNVETLANVPVIFEKGAEWFAQIGTEKSKGTKVFALAGKVNNVGLVEVPMGTTLRELIFEIGGGVRGGGKFKAAQSGGPSGGCIPEQFQDTPIDYQSLGQIGSMMGSGGMIVMIATVWSTLPASTSNSSLKNPAVAVCHAVWVPNACLKFSPTSPRVKAPQKCSPSFNHLLKPFKTPRFVVLAKPRQTQFLARSSTSWMNTKSMFTTSAVLLVFVLISSLMRSSQKNVLAVRHVLVLAP